MTLVWAIDLPDSEKIVLLALADCANDEGHCWPSMRSLTTKCSKSDRTIQYAIKRLVEEGHLTRREVPGKGCNYTVHPRNSCTPEEIAPPKGTTQTPEAASDKPSRTVNTEAKASSERVREAFNEGAKRYPSGVSQAGEFDASRRQMMRLRLKENGEAKLMEAVRIFFATPWLRGEGRDGRKFGIDFILQPTQLRRILEGFYGEEGVASPEWSPERQAAYLAEMDKSIKHVGTVVSRVMEGIRTQ